MILNEGRGYSAIGLVQPKDHNNVGHVLRAAGVFGSAFVATTGRRYKKSATDTRTQHKHMPLIQTDDLQRVIPYDCVPIAVDLIEGATPLPDFWHPERAFYIFGPEDGTLSSSVTMWCQHTIYIPTNGCMNLAATVNTVLYDRLRQEMKS